MNARSQAAALALLAGLITIPQGAAADEKRLGRPDTQMVLIWKSAEDYLDAIELIAAGVALESPELVIPFLKCVAQSGDKGVVVGGVVGSREIIVTTGRAKGCRGWISPGDLGE